jgi:glutamate decarboxylase
VVDAKDPKELREILNLDLPQGGQGKGGLLGIVEKILQYSVNTWDQGFMDKLYASTNAVGISYLCALTLTTGRSHRRAHPCCAQHQCQW